jgi:hypothetical protein
MTIFQRRRIPRDQQKELADQARLLRAWRAWHQEQLEEALAGAHGAVIAELMIQLDQLELSSAAALLACVRRTDWSTISYDTRLTVLHQINQAIMRLRERNGMAPIDDPLPGQPDNVFRRIQQTLFAAPPGAHPGSNRMKQGNDEQVKHG